MNKPRDGEIRMRIAITLDVYDFMTEQDTEDAIRKALDEFAYCRTINVATAAS